jgi:formylglycine-generating enzyme required for sulfatase activity
MGICCKRRFALSMYPWGGYYTRNYTGCFIANFKPLRGNYVDDGGFHTLIVANYDPNEFGLYDMAGNVAEWTANAFDESAYTVYTDDLNPDYSYDAFLMILLQKNAKYSRWFLERYSILYAMWNKNL